MDVLQALRTLAPSTGVTRPDNAFDCALKAHGCTGWTTPQYTTVKIEGQPIGLCPKRETHAQITARDGDARDIVATLATMFNAANPTYQIGSKGRTKLFTVKAAKA